MGRKMFMFTDTHPKFATTHPKFFDEIENGTYFTCSGILYLKLDSSYIHDFYNALDINSCELSWIAPNTMIDNIYPYIKTTLKECIT